MARPSGMVRTRGENDPLNAGPNELLADGPGLAHGVVRVLGADGHDAVPGHPQVRQDAQRIFIPRAARFETLRFQPSQNIGFSIAVDDDFFRVAVMEKARGLQQPGVVFDARTQDHRGLGGGDVVGLHEKSADAGEDHVKRQDHDQQNHSGGSRQDDQTVRSGFQRGYPLPGKCCGSPFTSGCGSLYSI